MIFNKRICVIFLACAVMITGAIFTWRSHKRLQIIEEEHARLVAQRTTLKARIQTAESDLGQAKADLKDENSATTPEDLTASESRFLAMVNADNERMKS